MIDFLELSPNEESVLQEVLSNTYENGTPSYEYWANRFTGLNYANESLLRSTLGSLCDKGYISIPLWPDNNPEIVILNKGKEYFSEKKRFLKEKKKEELNITKRDILVAVCTVLLTLLAEHIKDIVTFISSLF